MKKKSGILVLAAALVSMIGLVMLTAGCAPQAEQQAKTPETLQEKTVVNMPAALGAETEIEQEERILATLRKLGVDPFSQAGAVLREVLTHKEMDELEESYYLVTPEEIREMTYAEAKAEYDRYDAAVQAILASKTYVQAQQEEGFQELVCRKVEYQAYLTSIAVGEPLYDFQVNVQLRDYVNGGTLEIERDAELLEQARETCQDEGVWEIAYLWYEVRDELFEKQIALCRELMPVFEQKREAGADLDALNADIRAFYRFIMGQHGFYGVQDNLKTPIPDYTNVAARYLAGESMAQIVASF